jgi:hypothetical protein
MTMSYGPYLRPGYEPDSELPESKREVLAADRERWLRLGAGAHLDDWLAFGPGLLIRRHLAMKLSHVNKPEGKRYTEEYAKLMKRDGLDTEDKNTKKMMTHVLWLYEQPERLTILSELRAAMTPGARARLNSPIAARQQVEKVFKERKHATNGEAPPHRATTKEKLAESDRKIAQLKAKIAELTGGTLFAEFDLKQSTAAEIGTAIAGNISEGKFDAVVKAAKERYKATKASRDDASLLASR